MWSQNPSLETVNITANILDPPYLDCDCAESAYYDLDIVQWYLRNMSMGGARGVAFSVLGYKVPFAPFAKSWQCSGVPTNYLSFVIIDKVEPGDNETELMVNVTSFTGESGQGDYAIHACMCFSVYIKINTKLMYIHNLVLMTVPNVPSHTRNRSGCLSVCMCVCVRE